MLRKRSCWDVKRFVNAKKLCNSASKQQKKERLLQPKTRHQGKKTDAIFVKEAKIANAASEIRTFGRYLLGLQILMGRKQFSSFLNALKL